MIKPHLQFLLAVPAGWLMKSLEISMVALCLMMGMYDPVTGADFRVSTKVSADSLTVGDKFIYINTINADSAYNIEPAPIEGQLGDAVVLSDVAKIPNSEPGIAAYACTLAVYKPGVTKIPSLVFNVTDSLGNTEKITGDSVAVTVYSVLPADTSGIDIADIKGPMKLRGPVWPYLLIPGGIILIALAVILLRKYLRRGFEMPTAPPRPPWEIAYEKLDLLKNEKHTEFGRFKTFYFELSLIIREYIEGRYNIPAVESTTYELECNETFKEIETELYKRAFEMFHRADLTKFAKFQPTVNDAESDFKFANKFVDKTIPVIETPETKEEDLEEVAK